MKVALNKLFTSSGSPLIDLRLRHSPVQEFVDTFCEKVELVRLHSFIATEQASFYAARKATFKTKCSWSQQIFQKITPSFYKMLPKDCIGITPKQSCIPLSPTTWVRERYAI